MEQPITGPTGAITGYHAHVYYDEASRAEAAALREAADARFKVVLGRWRDMPVGPHPQAMYQIAFGVEEFPRLVPWLMLNRGSLVVLEVNAVPGWRALAEATGLDVAAAILTHLRAARR